METITKNYQKRENPEEFVFSKGSSKCFTDKALEELRGEVFGDENFLRPHVITIANQKGGVGKSTTCISLSKSLDALGYKVLLIDTDAQSNTTKTFLREKSSQALYDVFKYGEDPQKIIKQISDNLHILGSNDNNSQVDVILSDPKFTYNPANLLKSKLGPIWGNYDFIIIDTNPSFSALNVACIASCNRVISPVPLVEWEIDGIKQVAAVVKGINESLDLNVKLNFLVTKFSKNETTAYEDIGEIKKVSDEITGKVLNTTIPEASTFRKAQKKMGEINGQAYKRTLMLTREILMSLKAGDQWT